MLWVLLVVTGFFSIYLLETKFAGFIQSEESCVLGLTTEDEKAHICFALTTPQLICHLRVVSFNAVEPANSGGALSPACSSAQSHFLIEHVFPHLFESSSQRAESFVQAAEFSNKFWPIFVQMELLEQTWSQPCSPKHLSSLILLSDFI